MSKGVVSWTREEMLIGKEGPRGDRKPSRRASEAITEVRRNHHIHPCSQEDGVDGGQLTNQAAMPFINHLFRLPTSIGIGLLLVCVRASVQTPHLVETQPSSAFQSLIYPASFGTMRDTPLVCTFVQPMEPKHYQ